MLPCFNGCAYKNDIPGNAHIRCSYAWSKSPHEAPTNQRPSSATNLWFMFPLNYDPVWGPDECAAFSGTLEHEMVVESNPLLDILSLLG